MTGETCSRCGGQVVRTRSGRLVCTTVHCAGPAPTSPARIDPDAFSRWKPYEPPEAAGEPEREDDDRRWWTS